jgi:hypothetical protein
MRGALVIGKLAVRDVDMHTREPTPLIAAQRHQIKEESPSFSTTMPLMDGK